MKNLKSTLWAATGLFGLAALLALPVAADQIINDDLIVTQSACIGNDCVNGENFGFDTLRLKENNLRINFTDTSTTASFPQEDWSIRINDSTNGGDNYFAVEQVSAGKTPFRVQGGAPTDSLRIRNNGNVGLGTSTPVVELHVVDGDTPTLRLEQNGSAGFGSQTWDLAGNETNFFIRDVSNGSKLPFRIRPGAGTSVIDISPNGEVGINRDSANHDAELHVVMRASSTNDETLLLESFKTTGSPKPARIAARNADAPADFWRFGLTNAEDFVINYQGNVSAEVLVDKSGNVTAFGNFFSTACPSPTPCGPDYVFEADYELMPLAELETFVRTRKHLPNVPSAKELVGPINMTQMQLTLLEKIEELTLYTLEQQKLISGLQADLAEIRAAGRDGE